VSAGEYVDGKVLTRSSERSVSDAVGQQPLHGQRLIIGAQCFNREYFVARIDGNGGGNRRRGENEARKTEALATWTTATIEDDKIGRARLEVAKAQHHSPARKGTETRRSRG